MHRSRVTTAVSAQATDFTRLVVKLNLPAVIATELIPVSGKTAAARMSTFSKSHFVLLGEVISFQVFPVTRLSHKMFYLRFPVLLEDAKSGEKR